MHPPSLFIAFFIIVGVLVIIQLANIFNIRSNSDRATRSAYAAKALIDEGYPINAYTEGLSALLGSFMTDRSLQEIRSLLQTHLKTDQRLTIISISQVVNEKLFLIATLAGNKSYPKRGGSVSVPFAYSGMLRLEKGSLNELFCYGAIPENSDHDVLVDELITTIQKIIS